MLRNLAAIILATIIGLALAKFIEGVLGGGVAPGEAASAQEYLGLTVGYLIGAFAASLIALLVGRRWAPLGWLSAATIFFAAVITILSFKLPLWVWPLSAAACAAGGWLAGRLLKAERQYRPGKPKESLFDN